jgi:hypothetical protein
MLSRLVHVTVLPAAMVIELGLKAKYWIVTLICIAAGVGVAVDGGSGVAVAAGVGVAVGMTAVGVAVGWDTGGFAVGSGEGVAMATGVAVASGTGVVVGVEVAAGRVWTPGWPVAHLMGTSRRSTAELRVRGPCMMRSVPPTYAPISR